MISRAACAPRICLACRLGLAQRSATVRFRPLSLRDGRTGRRYASDSSLPDKALIERIISGKISDEKVEKIFRKNQTLERRRQKADHDLPDWGLKNIESQIEESPEEPSSQLKPKEDTKSTTAPEKPAENPSISTTTGDSTPLSNFDHTQESNPGDNDGASPLLELDHDSTPEIEILPRINRADKDASRRRTGRKPGRKHPDNGLLQDKALNVSALGKPVSAIVIKNPNEIRPSRGAVTELEEVPRDPNSTPDWNKVVHSKGQDLVEEDGEDYLKNLEELRPKDTRVLRMAEYQKLAAELVEGFMTKQLRTYYRDTALEETSGAEDILDYSWITKQFPWSPTTNLPAKKETEREKYARRIIFQRWQLQIQDQVDGPGRAYVWVDPDIFPLLTQGSYSVLDSLREEFLVGANDERMTTTTLESRINIHATKATTYGILGRINEIMKRLRRRLLLLPRRILVTRSELQELARITNTTLKYISKGHDKELEVCWLAEEEEDPVYRSPGLRTEDPAEIVYRLLNLRRHPGIKHSAQTILPFESQAEDGGVFVDYQRDLKSLSWKEKLGSWTRVIQPVNKVSSAEPSTLRISELAYIPDAPMIDSNSVTNHTIATFGSILHPDRGSNLSANHRVLCPVVPHPAAFSALKADDNQPPKQRTSIILNFVPRVRVSLNWKFDRMGGGPNLCLRLPVNADADLSKFSLPKDATFDAVVPWNLVDIMLPANSVDVRLVHHRHLSLAIQQVGLDDFLSHAEFNLLAGRLRTPSCATFELPKKYTEANYTGMSDPGETVEIPYVFFGLEIHQTVEMPWRGHTLRYSSIEAGQHGGQRQELSLQAGPPDTEVDFSGETRTSFLDLVEEIASGKAFSWDEGYKDMKETLFEDHSYDLPEKALGDDFVVTEVEAEQHDAEQSEKMELDEHDQSSVEGEETRPQPNAFSRFDDPDYYEEEVGLTPEEKEEMEREIDALLQLDSRPGSSHKSGSIWPDMEEEEASVDGSGRREASASEDTAWLFKNSAAAIQNEAGDFNEATSNEGSDLKAEVSPEPTTSEEKSAEEAQGNADDTPVADARPASSSQVPDSQETSPEVDGSVDLPLHETGSGAEKAQHESGNKTEETEEKGKN